ncbi:porin [Variovorax sp. Root434]|uniref:porin n=1 Tax=Variovorax sp. Root434 TaxID=1736536 RepID=UPI000AAC8472|nr:porin [Variovorax sp. Root434]
MSSFLNTPRRMPLAVTLFATGLCGASPALAQQAQKEELRQIVQPAGGMAASPSSLTMYGLIDTSLASASNAGGRVRRMDSGHMNGSRLGFKGSEDLGDGLRANFLLEMGLNSDAGTMGQNQGAGAKSFGRGAIVGLSGSIGEIRLGRTVVAIGSEVQAVGDAFGLGGGGNLQGIQPAPGRVNNTIWYQSPNFGGFIAKLSYSPGETTVTSGTATSSRSGTSTAASVFYLKGGLSAAIGYSTYRQLADASTLHWFHSAAAYDFGAAKLFGSYATFRNPGAAVTPATHAAADNNLMFAGFPLVGYYSGQDDRSASIGIAVPFGVSTVLAQVVRVDDKGPLNRDATQFGIAYIYALSKRTSLYADYGRIRNRNGAAYAVTGATSQAGLDRGGNSHATHVGVRVAF